MIRLTMCFTVRNSKKVGERQNVHNLIQIIT